MTYAGFYHWRVHQASKAALWWGLISRKWVGVFGRGAGSQPPPQQLRHLWERCKLPQLGPRRILSAQRFYHILSALGSVICCILRPFCSKNVYAVQRGKSSVRFLKAMWNSNCDRHIAPRTTGEPTHKHYIYTSARKKTSSYSITAHFVHHSPLPSARQHPSYGDCVEVKREYYQNSSVLDCVTQCSQSAAHSVSYTHPDPTRPY